MTIIAFLGIGLMGEPMVRNLAKARFELHVWNRSIAKAELLSSIATVHSNPCDAVKKADIVISMLSDGPVTTDVLLNQKVIERAPVNCLFINMASTEPKCDIALADIAKSFDKHFIDAPVSGGVKGAEEATLTIFVGGNQDDLEQANSIFDALGKATLIGHHGAGQTAKLANQLIVGITIGAVAEAFKIAESGGCDPAVLRQALRGGFADSRILELHGERMVTGNYEPGGKSSTQL